MTGFASRVRRNLERTPDRVALIADGRSWTFAELLRGARRFAAWLACSSEPGDRVGLLLDPSADLVQAYLGTILSSRIAVPLNPRLGKRERSAILESSRPAIVVSEDVTPLDGAANPTTADLRSQLDDGPEAPLDVPEAGAPLLLVYTSGTTGVPKGVPHTSRTLDAGIAALEAAWQLGPDDHLLLTLPLFHVHGLCVGLHGMLALGHRITLRPRFDADEVLSLLANPAEGFTLFYGVPTMMHRLIESAAERPVDLSHLRLVVSGSAPLPSPLKERFRDRLGPDLLERYGMTETLIVIGQDLDGERLPGRIGHPLRGTEARIVDEEDRALPPGEVGELQLRGDSVFAGYWADAVPTGSIFAPGGWLRTGDLALTDPGSGELIIRGRRKELIISGGENITPLEIENVLAGHEEVSEVAVFGTPDADLGEVVNAAVVVARGSGIDAEVLGDLCARELTRFKRPRRWHFVDALPRNALGKIDRAELTCRYTT